MSKEPRPPPDRPAEGARPTSKWRGAYIGLVTDRDGGAEHPYQVRLRFPWLPGDEDQSHWARIAVPMAGAERGAYFLPEVDDQVLVVFEHGDMRRPIVIGALWSKPDPPPVKNQSDENNYRVIKSRSGHRLIFDDSEGEERIVLVDGRGETKIVIHGARAEVTIDTRGGDINIRAPAGAVRLHADDIRIGANNSFSAQGNTKVQIATSGELTAVGSASLDLKGALVHLNP